MHQVTFQTDEPYSKKAMTFPLNITQIVVSDKRINEVSVPKLFKQNKQFCFTSLNSYMKL